MNDIIVRSSVADPDPHVFGPPGSTSQRYGSGSGSCSGFGSFYHQAKIVRKTLITTVLQLLFDFLSLKNTGNVNVLPSKNNKQKTLINIFVGILKVTDEKRRIRIR